ncbi:tol-pal system protein YbgF [Pedomonas mirosovicensis]|uniref:tol-pal system protein YbgF n=1 Tax=Pedomonas mirosovicensis TaxID=2908641 RepID=UPI002168BFE8|nr:tol-pal system protein YbgF [Pedomonas mirosovicensis]MCH8684721.1 tol-pal system protein YbgF [Pedomonas mirosovicensis]
MLKCRQVSVALILAVLSMPLVQGPAQAQSAEDVGKRIDKLEAEMRAVQRQVFPGGASKYFEPEFSGAQGGAGAPAAPAQDTARSDLLADMQARLTQLEEQLANLTGQVEEANFRARRAEDTLTKLREDMEYRLTVLEGGDPMAAGAGAAAGGAAGAGTAGVRTPAPGAQAQTPAPATEPGEPQPFPPPGFDPKSGETSANATDPNANAAAAAGLTPEEQYKAAYAFVNQNDYPRAEAALKTFIDRNPKSARTPDAMYWLGRVYLVRKSYAQAAKAFLDTYQQFPKANRAPDSLVGLGDALMGLGKPEEACQAYNELEAVYPSKITGSLKARLGEGRSKAKCG